MASKIIALAQQKGGVGKTTTVINLGSALAQRGKKVLLVDLDPQGALSAGLGLNPLSLERTIYTVLRNSSAKLSEIITQTNSGCDLVPSNIDLAAAEVELVSEPGREHFLREALAPVLDRYHYILIDCQPSLGLLTLNALSASSGVIIPVQTQYFALRGMDLLFQTIEKVQARLNPRLKIVGILPTMYDARTLHAREVMEELKRVYPRLVLNTVIPHTVKFADSSMAGESVLSLSPNSQAAEAYRELATEVEKRV
jgi:chromosome partitioning protein